MATPRPVPRPVDTAVADPEMAPVFGDGVDRRPEGGALAAEFEAPVRPVRLLQAEHQPVPTAARAVEYGPLRPLLQSDDDKLAAAKPVGHGRGCLDEGHVSERRASDLQPAPQPREPTGHSAHICSKNGSTSPRPQIERSAQ